MQYGNAIQKKEVTIKFMTLKNQNMLYIEREVIINLFTSTVLPYLKLLELKSCKENRI